MNGIIQIGLTGRYVISDALSFALRLPDGELKCP